MRCDCVKHSLSCEVVLITCFDRYTVSSVISLFRDRVFLIPEVINEYEDNTCTQSNVLGHVGHFLKDGKAMSLETDSRTHARTDRGLTVFTFANRSFLRQQTRSALGHRFLTCHRFLPPPSVIILSPPAPLPTILLLTLRHFRQGKPTTTATSESEQHTSGGGKPLTKVCFLVC